MSRSSASVRSLIFIVIGIAVLIYVAFLPFRGKDSAPTAAPAPAPAAAPQAPAPEAPASKPRP